MMASQTVLASGPTACAQELNLLLPVRNTTLVVLTPRPKHNVYSTLPILQGREGGSALIRTTHMGHISVDDWNQRFWQL